MVEPKLLGREFQAVLAAARAVTGRSGGPRHSPLYEWLWAHHGELATELNPPRTPNWPALAKQFGMLGVFDGAGKTPLPVTVRQTWAKVNRDKEAVASGTAKKRTRRPKAAVAPPSRPFASALPAPDPPPPASEPFEDAPMPRLRLRLRRNNSLVNGPVTKPKE